ncbi:hypothetical protein EYD10_15364 [Varanus komodoensis]|nr:hypothetical protein EYD10_15364 [Varanus komodoensis]
MAWPCISRACCIARFWNQLDKADIAVPLVFTKYSEATDIPGTQVVLQQQPHPPSAIESQPAALGGDLDGASRAAPAAADHAPGASGGPPKAGQPQPKEPVSADSVMRQDYKPWKVQRPEPSYKPRSEYQPSETPFQKESQYQKDFRPWPIPKRGDHPWIPKQMPIPALEADKGPKERSGSQERRRKAQVGPEEEPGREEVAAAGKPSWPEDGKAKKTNKRFYLAEDGVQEQQPPGTSGPPEGSKGRAAVDALNWQIKEEVTARVSTSSYSGKIIVRDCPELQSMCPFQEGLEKLMPNGCAASVVLTVWTVIQEIRVLVHAPWVTLGQALMLGRTYPAGLLLRIKWGGGALWPQQEEILTFLKGCHREEGQDPFLLMPECRTWNNQFKLDNPDSGWTSGEASSLPEQDGSGTCCLERLGMPLLKHHY